MADAVKIFVYRNGRRVLEDLGTASIPSNIPATNITITWTKAGTVSSNVVNILWEVS